MVIRLHIKILLFGAFLLSPAYGQFSPGELTRGHASLEGLDNCTQCHDVGKRLDGNRCLACHVELKNRMDNGKGFHASAKVKGRECVACHFDHKGRDFDITYWEGGKEAFDHTLTGYRLEGKHKTDRCEKCHRPDRIRDALVLKQGGVTVDLKKTHLGLSQECQSCHFDEHRGQFKEDCLKCHDFADWKKSAEVLFNHDSTAYRLTGMHSGVACAACHKPVADPHKGDSGKIDPDYARYKPLQFANCVPCHRDVHANRFGQDCKSCHTTFGWFVITVRDFDHKNTRYPLLGRHALVSCEACHHPDPGKPPVYQNMAFGKCADCHQDVHAGQFLRRADQGACEACHDVNGFVPSSFTVARHATESVYALAGAHVKVLCAGCHPKLPKELFHERSGHKATADSAIAFKLNNKRCATCHTDIHRGQFAEKVNERDCAACHRDSSWKALVFNHDTDAAFPLAGKHKDAACARCHPFVNAGLPTQYIVYKPVPMPCESCHRDVHEGQFATQKVEHTLQSPCGDCHNAVAWKPVHFDHGRQSKFALTGAHQKVECAKCHPKVILRADTLNVLYKPIDTACASCHPDIHEGAFEL